jgi:hypothetical protein
MSTLPRFIYLIGFIILAKLFWFLYKRNKTNQKVIKPVMHTKNKWLYPSDNFGKMEKGVVKD